MISITKFKFTGWVYLSYDRKSPEFIEAFESYLAWHGEKEGQRLSDFLGHVAGHLTEDGHHLREIDDIGYVQLEGEEKPAEWCGIVVAAGYNGRHTGRSPEPVAALTPEESQALTAARSMPNSLQAILALRKLATQGFWEPGEAGILAVESWDEEGETHARATPVLFTPQNQHYICRLHNVAVRLLNATDGEAKGS